MIKGCTNPECNSFKRNKHYTKKEIKYCPECGNILSHVCKKCPTVLDDSNKVYCMRCEQQKLENQEKKLDKAKKNRRNSFRNNSSSRHCYSRSKKYF